MEKVKKAVNYTQQKIAVPIIDLVLGRTMSKKLLVFFLATVFILKDVLDGDQWVTIAKWYFGSQGTVDVASAVMGSYNSKKKEPVENLDS